MASTNTLDNVVSSHTKKVVATAKQKTVSRMTKLEKAGLVHQKIDLEEVPVALDELFPRFDPAAMTTAYQDKKLGFTLPALFAFDLESEKAARAVRISHRVEFFGHPSSGERILNERAFPIWGKIRDSHNSGIQITSSISASGQQVLIAFTLLIAMGSLFIGGAAWSEGNDPGMCHLGFASAAIFGAIFAALCFAESRLPCTEPPKPTIRKDPLFHVAFEGVIPDRVRETIEKNKGHFTAMYLICDVANSWSMTEVARRLNPDPLVIGESKSPEGKTLYHLVDQFDLTPIEEHVRAEWTAQI